MADSSDPAFQNLNLPGWGPGRLAVVLVSLSGVAIALAIGSVAAYSWYGEIQRRIERVHPAVLEWSAASVAERVAHASVTIERAGAGIAPYEPGLVERLGELAASTPIFSSLVVVDTHGRPLAASGAPRVVAPLVEVLRTDHALDAGLGEAMAAADLRRTIADVTASSVRLIEVKDRSMLIASTPIGDLGDSLHGLLDSDELAAALRGELLGVGRIRLADAEGRVLAHTGDGSPETVSREALNAPALPRLNASWKSGSDWTVRSARPTGLLDLTLVIDQSLLPALKPMLVATAQMAVVAGIVLALFVGAASLLEMRLTGQLVQLLDGFRGIAKSDYSTRLQAEPVRGQLGLIYRVFNGTAARIEENQRKVEARIEAMSKQNVGFQKHHEVLAKLSVTDGLTQLHNHRYFQDQLGIEIKRLSRTKLGLSILLIDIDDFKQLNDTYGHAAGDEFLKQLARILKESVRETDVLARYGGEEFVVVAIGSGLEGASLLAEKLRMRIAETSFIVDESKRPRGVTVSIGVAEYVDSRTELFAAADAALYRAKAAGKNCVILDERTEA